jgi:elongation factor 3
VSFILHDPKLKHLPREQVVSALSEVGFTDAMQDRLITELSGGWKMKLALARAMLLNADILLLDGEAYGKPCI